MQRALHLNRTITFFDEENARIAVAPRFSPACRFFACSLFALVGSRLPLVVSHESVLTDVIERDFVKLEALRDISILRNETFRVELHRSVPVVDIGRALALVA